MEPEVSLYADGEEKKKKNSAPNLSEEEKKKIYTAMTVAFLQFRERVSEIFQTDGSAKIDDMTLIWQAIYKTRDVKKGDLYVNCNFRMPSPDLGADTHVLLPVNVKITVDFDAQETYRKCLETQSQ